MVDSIFKTELRQLQSTEDSGTEVFILSARLGVKCSQCVLIDLKRLHDDLSLMMEVPRQFDNDALTTALLRNK